MSFWFVKVGGLFYGYSIVSTVEEIEKAISHLPQDAFWNLTDRLIERREAAWDAQIETDSAAGGLGALWVEAAKEIDAGEAQSLDAFLSHEKLEGGLR